LAENSHTIGEAYQFINRLVEIAISPEILKTVDSLFVMSIYLIDLKNASNPKLTFSAQEVVEDKGVDDQDANAYREKHPGANTSQY
jgi:hypothetical protein